MSYHGVFSPFRGCSPRTSNIVMPSSHFMGPPPPINPYQSHDRTKGCQNRKNEIRRRGREGEERNHIHGGHRVSKRQLMCWGYNGERMVHCQGCTRSECPCSVSVTSIRSGQPAQRCTERCSTEGVERGTNVSIHQKTCGKCLWIDLMVLNGRLINIMESMMGLITVIRMMREMQDLK